MSAWADTVRGTEGVVMASMYRTVAPEGLELPGFVVSKLGDRTSWILDHGFSEEALGLDWWNGALRESGHEPVEWQFDTTPSAAGKITRRSLFAMGNSMETDDETLRFLVHVLAWGSGSSRRTNLKRLGSVLDPVAGAARLGLLREAAVAAQAGDASAPRRAYSALIRSGGGVIPGLGPAFFTKFLYFAGKGEGEVPCLILDARVAKRLHAAGWQGLPVSRGSYSYNWFTDTYESYCELLQRWASEQGKAVKPDEIERALFAGEGSVA